MKIEHLLLKETTLGGFNVKPLHITGQNVNENAEELDVGDPVIITGPVEFNGKTGDILAFGKDKRFVIVDLYNHGRHSFHSSDVEYNHYANSDDEQSGMYDRGEFRDDLDEAKNLHKRVRLVKTGETGTIRQIKHGAFKGAPKSYFIDLDNGGQADNISGNELRLVKQEVKEDSDYYYEQLAEKLFKQFPDLNASGLADEVLDAGWKIASQDLGVKTARHLFNYDEDFPGDFVTAYAHLQRGLQEAIKLDAPHQKWSRDELQSYLDRIKTGTKTKKDKFNPIIHGSNIKAIINDSGEQWDLDNLAQQIITRPRQILGTNAKMAKSKAEGEIVYDLTLPALSGIVVDEETGDFVEITTCPGAGQCQLFCYARKGGYVMFPASSMSAAQALNYLVNDPSGYMDMVDKEITTIKSRAAKNGIKLVVRWHDAGDFFSKQYLDLAFDIARRHPDVDFYAYTKMADVATDKNKPNNFLINFSSGSKRGEEKRIEFHKSQGNVVKQGVTVPKDMFFDLIARKGNSLIKDAKGRTQFKSPEALDIFKQRLAQQYKVSPDSIITYDQMLDIPPSNTPKWNVIVQPGAGDRAANRKDVIDSYLMFH